MMRKLIYALFFLSAISFPATTGQTDWSGGDGVPGPVTDWGDSYDNSSQIDSTNGTLQLSPAILAYPVEHTVDGTFEGAWRVHAADVDGDDDMDILGAANFADDITWWDVMGFAEEGILESSILDAGYVDTWDIFFSNSQDPTGTFVAFQFRSSSDAADMGPWSDTLFSSGTYLSDILADSTQYLQYRVILDSSDPLITPVLEDVQFSYTVYVSIEEGMSGDITSWAFLPTENPSYGHCSAMIAVPEPGLVELALYDVSGRVVAESSQEFPSGTHSVIFGCLAEGVYFCVMRAGEYMATEKVVVLQ